MTTAKFDVSYTDENLIHKIALRAIAKLRADLMTIEMDITACHANGNPLKLKELLDAPDFDFFHDVAGINAHIDRKTGKLLDFFSPRYSAPDGDPRDDEVMGRGFRG